MKERAGISRPPARRTAVLNLRETVGADNIRPLANCSHYFTVGRGVACERAQWAKQRTGYGAGAGESRREQRARRPLRQEDLDPAEKPPLLGEGDRVSGGRVETV